MMCNVYAFIIIVFFGSPSIWRVSVCVCEMNTIISTVICNSNDTVLKIKNINALALCYTPKVQV